MVRKPKTRIFGKEHYIFKYHQVKRKAITLNLRGRKRTPLFERNQMGLYLDVISGAACGGSWRSDPGDEPSAAASLPWWHRDTRSQERHPSQVYSREKMCRLLFLVKSNDCWGT